MKKLLLLLSYFTFTFFQINAQCVPDPNPTPGLDCNAGTLLCCGELDGLSGTLPTFVNPTGPVPLCSSTQATTPNNTEWLSFIPATSSLTFTVFFSNCTETGNGAGAQVGIYSDCTFLENIFCNDNQNVGEVVVDLSDLNPGQRHYLFLDGWAGSVCDYEITVISGSTIAPEDPQSPTSIAGPLTACPGESSNYIAGYGLNSGFNTWSVSPQDIAFTFDDNNATGITIVDWGSAIGGTAEICVTGGNECHGDADNNYCITVNVDQNPIVVATGTFPYCENGYVFPQNGVTYAEGTYIINVPHSDSLSTNCDTLYELSVVPSSDPLSSTYDASPSACANDGYIISFISGGVPPYAYQWAHGPTDPELDNLFEGEYILEITDNNGCSITDTLFIDSSLDFDLQTSFTGCDLADGSAEITAADLADLNVAWSTGDTGPLLENLAVGGYSVTVTNAITNCVDHEVFVIEEDSTCYATISGYVFAEKDLDCANPENTITIPGIMIDCSDGQTVFTNQNGYYEFRVDLGTYTITLGGLSSLFEAPCFTTIDVEAPDFFQVYGENNFNLEYLELPDIELKVWKQNARPGFEQDIRVCVMNRGALPVVTTITCEHPDIMTFLSANPTESNYSAADYLITWEDVEVQPGVTEFLRAEFQIPATTMIGTPVTYTFRTDDDLIALDQTPENNVLECNRVITGSYDPNDKQVEPIGSGPEGILAEGVESLSYQIRFQNTGTDTAFTVLLRDTLSEHLDPRTIRLGASSHTYQAALKAGNILEVLYENILLPDSFVNEPASNGFFFFDIDLKPDLPKGTRITNSAGIYFDYNLPIITNEVVSTTALPSSTKDEVFQKLELYPNPTNGNITLFGGKTITAIKGIELLNISGERIDMMALGKQTLADQINLSLPTEFMTAGVYLLKVTLEDGAQETLKFVLF